MWNASAWRLSRRPIPRCPGWRGGAVYRDSACAALPERHRRLQHAGPGYPHLPGCTAPGPWGVYIVPQARIAAWQAFADAVTGRGCTAIACPWPMASGLRALRSSQSARTSQTRWPISGTRWRRQPRARALKGLLTHDSTALESQIDAYGDLLGSVGAELKQASEDARQLIEAALYHRRGQERGAASEPL